MFEALLESLKSTDFLNNMGKSRADSQGSKLSDILNKDTIATKLLKTTSLIPEESPQQKYMLSKEQLNAIASTKPIQSTYHTMPVRKQLQSKYNTFTNWSYKQDMQQRRKKKKGKSFNHQTTDNVDVLSVLMKFAMVKGEEDKQKKALVIQELSGVKQKRRDRLKKASSPLVIIKHYIGKEEYKPSKEATVLMERVVKISNKYEKMGGSDLEFLLSNIYKAMNMAVDYNQMYFLCLLVIMTADICYQAKDYARSMYFYNQARIASTYAQLLRVKTDALLGMGRICLQIRKYKEALIMFKKCLQYCWKTRNNDTQLRVYDQIGKCYYYQGCVKTADYFHSRYIQGQLQLSSSAIKKISLQMLDEYMKRVVVLERRNLSSLFLQYLNLPIRGFAIYPPSKLLATDPYTNYDDEGLSPRRKRAEKGFTFQHFPDIDDLLAVIFKKDFEFHSQIPLPDVHRNFIAEHKYGRPPKNTEFTKTAEYHRLVGGKPPPMDLQSVKKYPLHIRIEKRLHQKRNPRWWQDMVDNTKKQRAEKVGQLRAKIVNAHESHYKYAKEKRRAQSYRHEKIKESFNRTLLDFIDPPK